ncbi:ATP-binding cassette domain-containing protein [Leucobacter sp. cx-42]|uniref:ATP-binding cassette domain-containing protein n=1 Tax=unclassified Leucobacter TaxID=2621730 RepID=UPI00165D6610|nr:MULTISPECIES: ATP-binding cassette domain-containing protein [unclassified Leucobacter]MBC9953654.1 ATP-binding cassette domain-containing protein [Leucobacter sp. cx-42]
MPRLSNDQEQAKPAIVFTDVTKTFQINHTSSLKETVIAAVKRKNLKSSFNAVDHLSFEVPEGQSIALLGRNGSGKSTTLKLLSGVMRPDSGWIRTRGRVAGLLEVGAGFHPDLTGRENVYLNAAILGMSKEETDARFDSILEFSEIGEFIDAEVKRYSSGMYSRLGFSVAVHTELDVLLVDEILSVGDAQFRKKCTAKMKEFQASGKTMFIVSHNANQVKELCERGIVLDHGKMVFDGPIDEAVEYVRAESLDDLKSPFEIHESVYDLYADNPARWGMPTGPAERVTANGGGYVQHFARGVITYSETTGANGLVNGFFSEAYRQAGGPQGAWGFLAGAPHGSYRDAGVRELPFQNGTAEFTVANGIEFVPNP